MVWGRNELKPFKDKKIIDKSESEIILTVQFNQTVS